MSVVLPSRDRPRLLERALRCALGQDGVSVEVVVVDDGSTPAISQSLVPSLLDDRVRVIRHERSRGVAGARNVAIAAARASAIAFLDDDDVWAPEKLQAQLAALDRSDARFAYTGTLWVDGELRPLAAYPPTPGIELKSALRRSNVIGTPSALVAEKDLLLQVGGFDERLAVLADWELWIRLADRASGAAVPGLLLGYVVHDESMHRRQASAVEAELIAMRDICSDGNAIGGIDFWRWAAMSRRDAGHWRYAAKAQARVARISRQPRDVARAVKLLFGERAARLGGRPGPLPPSAPRWLTDLTVDPLVCGAGPKPKP